MRRAEIFVNNVVAGILTEREDGSFVFQYHPDYFSNPSCSAISLTMPKTEKEFTSKTLFPFFSNMLSEGVNRRIQARNFKIDEEDDFGLLLATAQNDVIGAITIENA